MLIDIGNEIIILFYGVIVGNLLAPLFLPLIAGIISGGFMPNVNADDGAGQGFKAALVSLGAAALWTLLFLLVVDSLERPNLNVFFGGLAAANLCGVVAAIFFCRSLSDYREFEHVVNRRRR